MGNQLNILIVDDEREYSNVLAMVLEAEGYPVSQCQKPKEVMKFLKSTRFDLIVSDLIMPEMDGISLLSSIKTAYPDLPVIMLTAYGTIENAVQAMKEGAFSYVIKGNDPEELLKEVHNIEKLHLIQHHEICQEPKQLSPFMLNTKNKEYGEILQIASKAATRDVNVLLLGESGVGKEVVAQYIHNQSSRKEKGFHATNCHIFSESLLESELFGHEKGSFTGAVNTRIGRFEAAEYGTLFLDEIGDVPLPTQAKLLRAIETKSINRIGSNEEINVDFRLISATNRNIEQAIQIGELREDLFYRLSTIIIQIPPLRNRREDLPSLIDFFIEKTKVALSINHVQLEQEVMDFLLDYPYPGNIRELKNIIERLFVLSDDGVITGKMIPRIIYKNNEDHFQTLLDSHYSLKDLRREVEAKYIERVLSRNHFNVSKSARDLGVSTRLLFYKIAEYQIKDDAERSVFQNE